MPPWIGKSPQSMTINHLCFNPHMLPHRGRLAPLTQATCSLQHISCWPHHVSSSCELPPWYSNTMLTHLYTLISPMPRTSRVSNPTVTLKPWECTFSRHHQSFLLTFYQNINSIKNPSPSPSKCKSCPGPWSNIHLICNMLSMMFGVNVLHEINCIYHNTITHMCKIHLLKWRDPLINLTLNAPHPGPWSNLHHICNVLSLKSTKETSIHLSHLPCVSHDRRSISAHVSKVDKSRLNPCPTLGTKASSSLQLHHSKVSHFDPRHQVTLSSTPIHVLKNMHPILHQSL